MALAETAELAVLLKLNDQLSGPMGRVQSQMGKLEGATGKFSGALGHAKNQLGGLVSGPLGLLGVGAGLFTFAGALETGIHKAQDFGAEVIKMSKLTGLSVETTSALASALDHFGVSADSAMRLTGFLEKNVGLLAARKDGIVKFQEAFGLAILDSNGKIKNANELILTTADYFNNKSIPATTKAAAIAKLYGRSWQDLIPFLSAGRQGILDAEQAAKDFGLTLTADNIDALRKMKAATRDWGDALGGLELQIGLALIPALTDLAKVATRFVADNRTKIVDFFKNLAQAGRDLGAVIEHQVIPVFKGIANAWNSLPPEVRDIIVKGVVAEKAVKFLFGVSPTSLAKDAIGGLVGQFFQRGTPGNPMWVASTIGGGGAVTAANRGSALMGLATKVFLVGAAIGVFAELKGILDEQSARNKIQESGLAAQTKSFTSSGAGGASLADLKKSLQGLDAHIASLRGLDPASLAFQLNIDGVRTSVDQTRAQIVAAIDRETTRLAGAAARTKDDTVSATFKAHAQEIAAAARYAASQNDVARTNASRTITAIQAIAIATKAAGQQAAFAIRDSVGKTKVTVVGSPITVNVTASSINKAQATFKKAGNVFAL